MNWLILALAGCFEMGWPLGFKLASTSEKYHYWFIAMAVVSMAISGFLLYVAQRTISIGTAYAVWTGIGAVGTLLIGIFCFGDSASIWRLLSATLIVMGIVGLKLAH